MSFSFAVALEHSRMRTREVTDTHRRDLGLYREILRMRIGEKSDYREEVVH